MKEIYTNKGVSVQVDDEDYSRLCEYTWHLSSYGYAKRTERYGPRKEDKKLHIFMHRLIMENPDQDIDHMDGNPLNNQKHNLRLCTHSENMMNKKIYKSNKSGYTGVHWYKNYNKWIADIRINKKKINLGYFTNLEDAIFTRREAELKYFGDFARKLPVE